MEKERVGGEKKSNKVFNKLSFHALGEFRMNDSSLRVWFLRIWTGSEGCFQKSFSLLLEYAFLIRTHGAMHGSLISYLVQGETEWEEMRPTGKSRATGDSQPVHLSWVGTGQSLEVSKNIKERANCFNSSPSRASMSRIQRILCLVGCGRYSKVEPKQQYSCPYPSCQSLSPPASHQNALFPSPNSIFSSVKNIDASSKAFIFLG